ncbi:DUF1549 and DUF1553 domain-containing protein [Akkermansiaceae bacterium]|nr:DUF1549 and DUF1553 domain-containing protein [Akkermansiaceae bacterium]MDA7626458.1 DUF1549 and DUF1553 domain-containing protein [Akkermansiaceae bacterium]MDA7871619.1 DUF1549 and DUF1553 domain-containing protein [Akkermansiaceae bacterium]MDA7910984.1 DUF1549 and DUF1553 domain-containing protein [Akkermansiaceae bacterium]MDA8958990.1 DUF1549 and DUF1553 domain-containing protein [Akkermansiaceae bacterium]
MLHFVSIFLCLTGSLALGFENSPTPQKQPPNGEHWAFKMPVANEGSIDRLINSKLTKVKLVAVPKAPREVLIRRIFHVITGLLPTPKEKARWIADTRANWLAHLTEDLLDRPSFGEKWGRHWLDVARYADTRGAALPDNEDFPYAFTYRDWVIRAFNESLPYDQFLHYQIAADLMDLPREELAALGFLTVGRAYQGGQNHLVIADRIDVATRSTMGLTVACARCHDHKTDPIPTADYYALYGVFNSSLVPKELPVIAEPSQEPGAIAYRSELKKKALVVHKHVEKCVPSYKTPTNYLNFNLPSGTKLNQTQRDQFRKLTGIVTRLQANSPYAIPRAMVLREKPHPFNPRIHERGNPRTQGESVFRAFLSIFREKDEHFTKGSGRLEFAHRLTDNRNPLTSRVWANRVWMHLTGSPIVNSPGDFGPQTERPIQLELLDSLALFLTNNKWSTKALIKHIITSETFQRSSQTTPELREKDPSNIYHARANRQRKDLEAWRDSALQVSGRLVRKMGGKPFNLDQPPYEGRRTIYAKTRRGFLPSVMRAFDFPGSEEALMKRTTTTTPTQALYLMNSPFLLGEARAIAKQTSSIKAIYRTILQRDPTTIEIDSTEAWLGRAQSSRTSGAWDYGYLQKGSLLFKPLPHFEKGQWRGTQELPDQTLGWLNWTSNGGHPETDKHATLKWTAIESGKVNITGSFVAPSKKGNGLIARIMKPDGEILGEWTLNPTEGVPTKLKGIEVKEGDELWFVADSRDEVAFDSFRWAPKISDLKGLISDAENDFSGPGLAPQAQLAQTLLLSNEFFYID